MPQKEFKLSNFRGLEDPNLQTYITTLDADVGRAFKFIQLSRKRSIPLTVSQIKVVNGTATTIGTTPTVDSIQINATTELLSFFIHMPVDWDKETNTSLDLVWSLKAIETTADELNITYDYVVPKKETTASGIAKTSTSVTSTTTVTTGNGLAVGDIYVSTVTFDKNDANNGHEFGDKSIGFAIEFHLTNTTGVGDIDLVGGQLNYVSFY